MYTLIFNFDAYTSCSKAVSIVIFRFYDLDFAYVIHSRTLVVSIPSFLGNNFLPKQKKWEISTSNYKRFQIESSLGVYHPISKILFPHMVICAVLARN